MLFQFFTEREIFKELLEVRLEGATQDWGFADKLLTKNLKWNKTKGMIKWGEHNHFIRLKEKSSLHNNDYDVDSLNCLKKINLLRNFVLAGTGLRSE